MMNGDESARLIYLTILAVALIGWYISSERASLGKAMKQIIAWVLIFVGIAAAIGLWQDMRGSLGFGSSPRLQGGIIEIPRSIDGHFYINGEVNGANILFLVDTGATGISLSKADARRAGIDPDQLQYNARAQTANGEVAIAQIRVNEFRIGDIRSERARMSVNGGDLHISLLGMGYLGQFARVSIEGERLILEP